MMDRWPYVSQKIDHDLKKHRSIDALATSSFKLTCGCNIRHDSPQDALRVGEIKTVGCAFPCGKHGETMIVRVTSRLVGWKDDPPPGWRP